MHLGYDLVTLAEPNQRAEVLDMTVHPAIRYKPHQMQWPARFARGLHRVQQGRVLEETAILYCVIDIG
jgi:hypothetical protein